MQKNLEILKETDDLVIKKLSEKKFLLKTNVNVLSSNFEVLYCVKIKYRYKINKDGEYKLIGKMRLMNILSQKFGVKLENMYLCYETQIHLNNKFELITGIRIKDTTWVRNHKLKQILNEVVSN